MVRTTLITHPGSGQTKLFASQFNRQVWTSVWGLLDNFAIALIEESPPKVRLADSSAIRMILIRFLSVFLTSVKWEIETRRGVIFQSQDFRTLASIYCIIYGLHYYVTWRVSFIYLSPHTGHSFDT